MDLTAQLCFLGILVLANGQILLSYGPPGHRDLGPSDIFNPLHPHPHRGPFDHHPPGPGSFGHHQRDHGIIEDFLDPPFRDSNNRNEGRNNQNDNIRVTTDRTALKVNLLELTEPQKNNIIHRIETEKLLESKENNVPVEKSNIQSGKHIMSPILQITEEKIRSFIESKDVIPPTLSGSEKIPLGNNENINNRSLTIPAGEQILRTNENRTVTPKPIVNQILKTKNNTSTPVKHNVTQENTHSGEAIVFPDNVEQMKSKSKEGNHNMNKACNVDMNNNKLNVTDKLSISKNRDGVVIPVQAVPVNPVQDTNGKFLLVPINSSGNIRNQPLPITIDVFAIRSPVYTTVRSGQVPLYTNVISAIPVSIQPTGTWNNGNNNYYQNAGITPNPTYNTAVNYPNRNNLNPNLAISNPNQGQMASNSVGIPTIMYNPTLQQLQPNGYNNQPNYNNQQESQNPARNFPQEYGPQTVASGVVPTYNHIEGSQGTVGQNNVLNYNGNNGQTYAPAVPNHNMQLNPNGQQFYIIPNNQPNNNMNTGQPIILNAQGNAINSNPNNGGTNQQYVLVNANQLNIPQNSQGNNNIYRLQNGQLVALVPVQVSNDPLLNNNNAINQITPVNSNVQPNTLLPTTVNSQPNIVTMNGNPNQPNLILMNGNAPDGTLLLNGQTSTSNNPTNVPNGPIILTAQTTNLHNQNSLPNDPIVAQNVLGNGQTPLVNNGPKLYTMVNVPNHSTSNVGSPGYQVPGSVNLDNTRDKVDKEDSGPTGNNGI